MFINGALRYTVAAPVQLALHSFWLAVHVSAVSVGSGVFLVPGVASTLYLVRAAHHNAETSFVRLAPKLPLADVLDRNAYRSTIVAFPIFTIGVLCGAVWAGCQLPACALDQNDTSRGHFGQVAWPGSPRIGSLPPGLAARCDGDQCDGEAEGRGLCCVGARLVEREISRH
jgi:hypothetical protein